MKKRTAFVGAILSLIPLGQPLIIKTGLVLSSSALMISLSDKSNAADNSFYFNRAFEKGENGDHYGAISDYTKAIEIDPNDSTAYYNRGLAKHNLKDYYGAISDYTKAIKLDPRNTDALDNRGLAKHNLEDYYGAISDYTRVIEINPDDGFTYSNRGITKGIGFNDDEGACDDFKKAASLGYQYRIDWLETSEGKWCKDM